MTIPIFCINLERATERRKKIEKLWINELGFDIVFWKAWDRRDIEKGRSCFAYSAEKARKVSRELTSGENACVTSRYMVHEYCIKNDISNYIVMEDGILPSENIKSQKNIEFIIEQGLNEFPNASIYFLAKATSPLIFNEHKQYFSFMKHTPWGNLMNFYTSQGRDKMYNSLKSIKCIADHWHKMDYIDVQQDIVIINQNQTIGSHEPLNISTTYIGNYKRLIHKPFIK